MATSVSIIENKQNMAGDLRIMIFSIIQKSLRKVRKENFVLRRKSCMIDFSIKEPATRRVDFERTRRNEKVTRLMREFLRGLRGTGILNVQHLDRIVVRLQQKWCARSCLERLFRTRFVHELRFKNPSVRQQYLGSGASYDAVAIRWRMLYERSKNVMHTSHVSSYISVVHASICILGLTFHRIFANYFA